jgi:hypothetical protein
MQERLLGMEYSRFYGTFGNLGHMRDLAISEVFEEGETDGHMVVFLQ